MGYGEVVLLIIGVVAAIGVIRATMDMYRDPVYMVGLVASKWEDPHARRGAPGFYSVAYPVQPEKFVKLE